MSAPELRWIRPELNENARRIALATISDDERQRYAATATARQDTFLAGRLILRRLVAELTDIPARAVELSARCPDCGGAHGRPTATHTGLHLSLTHGADAVVAAASNRAIGIDIERPAQPAGVLSAIASLTGKASVQHWMHTEAILKADGRGLRVDPALVTIEGARGWVEDAEPRYELSEVELASGVSVSIAIAA